MVHVWQMKDICESQVSSYFLRWIGLDPCYLKCIINAMDWFKLVISTLVAYAVVQILSLFL